MSEAGQRRAESAVQHALPMYRGVIRAALQGSASPRQAIKAHCLTCTNYQREEVKRCPVVVCPLWRYRPYQTAEGEEAEAVES